MLDRVYGNTLPDRFKDGASVLLLPNEKPRERYPFPAPGSPCPHCGKRAGFIHTEDYFECWCGTVLWNEEPIPWQRESNARLVHRPPKRREIAATCQKCGKGFPTNNHNGMVKWCPECREDVRREKENARLRAKREEKKRATTPSLGDSIVIVSKQRG